MSKKKGKNILKKEIWRKGVKEPSIFFTEESMFKMQTFCDKCNIELGWLGEVEVGKDKEYYLITDVYLIEQEASGGTCELTPDGLYNFSMGRKKAGLDNNKIRFWGHSHVNMGVSPSSQDNTQLQSFGNGCEFYIRLIMNKKGNIHLTFYDIKEGIAYIDMPYAVLLSQEKLELQKKIEEEIKEKVKRKTYTTKGTNKTTGFNVYGGRTVYNKEGEKKTINTSNQSKTTTQKTTGVGSTKWSYMETDEIIYKEEK